MNADITVAIIGAVGAVIAAVVVAFLQRRWEQDRESKKTSPPGQDGSLVPESEAEDFPKAESEAEDSLIPVSKAKDFADLVTMEDKKRVIHEIESNISGRNLKLSQRLREQYESSDWELYRITLYLFEEHNNLPDVERRLSHVRQEFERVRVATQWRSLVPLHYSVRSILKRLKKSPEASTEVKNDVDLFEDIRDFLEQRPDLPKGDPVKGNVKRVIAVLQEE